MVIKLYRRHGWLWFLVRDYFVILTMVLCQSFRCVLHFYDSTVFPFHQPTQDNFHTLSALEICWFFLAQVP